MRFSSTDYISFGFIFFTCIYLTAVLKSPYFSYRDMLMMRHLGLMLISVCLYGLCGLAVFTRGYLGNPTPLIIAVIYTVSYFLYSFAEFMLPFKVVKVAPPAPTPSMVQPIPVMPTPVYAQPPAMPVYQNYQASAPAYAPSFPIKN